MFLLLLTELIFYVFIYDLCTCSKDSADQPSSIDSDNVLLTFIQSESLLRMSICCLSVVARVFGLGTVRHEAIIGTKRSEKPCLWCYRPGTTQSGTFPEHDKRLIIVDLGSRGIVLSKVLISCAVTCAFFFAAESMFSHVSSVFGIKSLMSIIVIVCFNPSEQRKNSYMEVRGSTTIKIRYTSSSRKTHFPEIGAICLEDCIKKLIWTYSNLLTTRA